MKLLALFILIVVLVSGCAPQDAVYVNSDTPIDVNVSSGSITAGGISTGESFPEGQLTLAPGAAAGLLFDQAGNLITRSSVLTDEGSFYDPFVNGVLLPVWNQITDAGASITVANSLCNLVSGTTANSRNTIWTPVDFPPITGDWILTISQRIVNQTIKLGFGNNGGAAATQFARFSFSGVDNTVAVCESQSSADAGALETTTIVLPNGLTTAQKLQYSVYMDARSVKYFVNVAGQPKTLVATHITQIPDPYEVMGFRVVTANGAIAPASSTTVAIDTVYIKNNNVVDISGDVTGNVNVAQNVIASIVNSSTTALAKSPDAGYIFVGKAESTLGVAGIQVSLKTGQNCTVYVEQSPDGTNWGLVDVFNYKTIYNFGITTQAISSYYRVRVENMSTVNATGDFRLQAAMCPIVEAIPRALSEDGNLKVGVYEIMNPYGESVDVTPGNSLSVANPVRLIGTAFVGNTIDTNFWTSTVAANGTGVQSGGQFELRTNTTANGSSILQSVRAARKVSGISNMYRSYVDYGTTPNNNTKQWGVGEALNYNFTITAANATVGAVYSSGGNQFTVLATIVGATTLTTYGTGAPSTGVLTKVSGTGDSPITFSASAKQTVITDGAVFEVINGVLSVALYKGGTPSRIANGSFNGEYGNTLNAVISGSALYEIVYRQDAVRFMIQGKSVHIVNCAAATWANTLSFPIYQLNSNTSGSTTDTSLKIRDAAIIRLGELASDSIYKYISTATTTVCKIGAGRLHAINNLDNAAATATIYDGLNASGTVMGVIDLSKVLGTLNFDFPFFAGLTIVTTGSPKLTVTYE